MKHFSLGEIANACNGKYVGDDKFKDVTITSVERDSRNIKQGSLFLAIKGARADGHDFIEKCYDKGAVCALCEKAPKSCNKPYILVKSTLDAIKQIAKVYREKFDIPVIGISGSVGKTSTKEMIYSVLSQKFKTHKTQANLNNELGVPLTLLSMPEDTEVAVIEMGISDFGEMTRLSQMVQPSICVLTIIGCCHLENLKDLDGVLKAKTEMFNNARKNAEYILNGDDKKLSELKAVNNKKPIFFGLKNTNDFYAINIHNNSAGLITAQLCHNDKKLSVSISAIGNYMVNNALAAFSIGNLLGLSDEQIINGVQSYKTVGSRARVINNADFTIIDDCYNANPNSVKASLDTLKDFDSRTVAILGDMKELGKDELKYHFEVGKYAKECGIDKVYCVGELAKEIAKGFDGEWFENTQSLLKVLPTMIKEGDTILVKASHSMNFSEITNFLVNIKKL